MSDIDTFKSQAKISRVIGDAVKLKRSGNEFSGLCPFHNEKTPSFTVNDQKGFYHCFGCGAHGDVIDFITEHDGLPFKQAIDHIAQKCQINPPKPSEKSREHEPLYKANEAAAAWFISMHDPNSTAYLKGRGVDQNIVDKFQIGHAPKSRAAMIDHLLAQGFDKEILEISGLAYKTDEGSLFPRFFHRITFPVFNRSGRVCGFTARALGDAKAKYLNTASTPIFDKGRLLYGAKQISRKDKEAPVVLVEGAMDVVAMSRASLNVSVAPLGTACSTHQLLDLWSMHDAPIICLDGDDAGLSAGRRLIATAFEALRPGKTLNFARLPKGADPDAIVSSKGSASMAELLARKIPMTEFLWRYESRDVQKYAGDFTQADINAHLFQRCKDLAQTIPDRAVRQTTMLDINQRWRSLINAKSSSGSFIKPPVNMAEADMLSIALVQPEILDLVEDELEGASFSDDAMDRCREVMAKWSMGDISLSSGLTEYLIAHGCGDAVLTLMNTVHYRKMSKDCPTISEAMAVWRSLSGRYFSRVEKKMAKEALAEAIEGGDEDEIMRRMEMYNKSTYGAS